MTQIELFKGSDRRKQNPQNWLLKLEGAKFNYDTADEQRIYTFQKHLEHGSRAQTWWNDELNATDKSTWAHVEAAFHKKWPPTQRVKPTMEDRQEKLFHLKLTENEVGEKVGDDEDELVYSHIDWALKVLALAEDIEDDKGMLIPVARNNLPLSVRTLLPNDISTWDKFTDGVCNISINRLLDEKARDKAFRTTTEAVANLTITQPTSRYNFPAYQRSPYRTPYQRTQPMTIEPQEQTTTNQPSTPISAPKTPNARTNTTNDPFTGSTIRATTNNTRFLTTPASPSANRGSGYVKLAQQSINDNRPYNDTEDGRQKYQTALASWTQKYGGIQADWNTGHIPLTPGSSPLGSNECYTCGRAGHRRDECTWTGKPIPDVEANWRARINGLVRPRRARFTESPGAVPVFLVDADEVEIDPDVYDTTGLEFTDYEDQGNGQGSR
jgi:hypothetical protein